MTTNRFATEPTVVDLLAGVATGARDLASAHAAQLRAELAAEASRGLSAATTLVSGAILCVLGFAFLLVGLVVILSDLAGWPVWAAWLIVGGVVVSAGAIIVAIGLNLWKSFQPLPNQTIRSIQESLSWINSK